MSPKLRVFLITFCVSLPLDLITKQIVDYNLTFADRVPVIEGFFYLTHVRNTGAAFGLFQSAPATLRLAFFVGIASIAVAIIIQFMRSLAPGDRLSALALGLILGGAVGNLYDRIRLGEVIDFLHFDLWGGYSWPDFNVADSAIVVGVCLLILELLASEGEERAEIGTEESSQ
jgi:signal peptidase II